MEVLALHVKEIRDSVHRALEWLRWEEVVQRGDTVLLKPNFLTRPRDGVTTHIGLIKEVIEIVKGRAGRVVVGETDSTGRSFEFVASKLDLGCELVNLSKDRTVRIRGKYGVYNLPELAFRSKLINLPVLKTHSLTKITGAIKNLFGLIQDERKEVYHYNIDKVLTDLYWILKPPMNIMDGIFTMDGEGPSHGRVRTTNFILASRDALSLDLAACRIIGCNVRSVGHLMMASGGKEKYELIGEVKLEEKFEMPWTGFDRMAASLIRYKTVSKILSPIIRRFF